MRAAPRVADTRVAEAAETATGAGTGSPLWLRRAWVAL